ncbi:MAG: hypothetical protein FJW38_11680 [Acidobacteria bacterium]|nr:hypothetical protein [Acidobacteriota bacterium]
MILRLFLVSLAVAAQEKPPVFYSWHAFETVLFDNGKTELDALFHFRTRDRFSVFQLARGSVYGSQRIGKHWLVGGGFFVQAQEAEPFWAPQKRFWGSVTREIRTRRFAHLARFQTDRLFGMRDASYTRYRFFWQSAWRARISPYAGNEEFVEHAGHQRTRPRVGVAFAASRSIDVDIHYAFDHIYLRNPGNRHILQTTFSFHKPSRD